MRSATDCTSSFLFYQLVDAVCNRLVQTLPLRQKLVFGYLSGIEFNSAGVLYPVEFLLDRKVSADGVINIDCKESELDYRYQNQRILLRYSTDMSKVYVVDRIDNSMKEIKLLDEP